jgi:serine/threonine protein kinase
MAQFAPESDTNKQEPAPPTPPARGDSDPLSLPTGTYESKPLSGEFEGRVTTPQGGPSVPTVVRPASGRFGAYELLEEIRHGGMGVVYKARDTRLDRIVALKTMRADVLGQTPEMVERFRREAQAIAQLSHAHIIPIHDFGEQDGQHYFAMAFAVGGGLAQHLDRYIADVRAAAGLLEKIARAVQYAHDKGILHRDLKPANVLLDEHGEPLVSDFGLAKFVHADSELTQTGAVIGTPSYMAPEQAGGLGDRIGPATDIWALGVMLYELLTGRRPFVGSNSEEVRRQVREADPPRPRVVRPGLDRSLETIVLKCLDKEPARRYGSAGALADDLERWLRGEPILARPEGWRGKLERTVRRHPNLSTALLVAVVVAVVTAAAIKKLGDRTGPPRETPPSDLDCVAQEVHNLLERGEAGTLIGETGPPRGSRWVLGGGGALDAPSADRPFGVSAYDLAMLELLPATLPQPDTLTLPDRYTLRADVKPTAFEYNTTSGAWQGLGFYFGYNRQATQLGVEHCFYQLVLSYPDAANGAARNNRLLAASTLGLMDAPPGLGLGRAVSGLIATRTTTLELCLYLRRYRERGPVPTGSSSHRSSTGVVGRTYAPVGDQTWHPLAVKVMPETVEAFWGKDSIGTWRRDDPLLNPKRVLEENPELDPKAQFGPRGGLGLCVERGGAQFRRVVIQPFQ